MCGIWALIRRKTKTRDDSVSTEALAAFKATGHRGPDHHVIQDIGGQVTLGFHRLAIIDPSEHSHQPLTSNLCHLVCNGEIYNYHQLDHDYTLKTRSDCEVIIPLYRESGIEATCRQLDAEFAFVLYDQARQQVHLARDPFGVRPMFYGFDAEGNLYACSEAKGIAFLPHVHPFPPGKYFTVDLTSPNKFECSLKSYFSLPDPLSVVKSHIEVRETVNNLLTEAVSKRLMSDRPLGCLLSGGLDSSLITSLAVQLIPNARETLHCFSIGMPGSVDISAARKVAEYLGIRHHHVVEFEPQDGFEVLSDVIRQLETYDVTTVRASIPQYLLARYISQKTDIKVLLSGEGADELFAGYQYFKMTDNETELSAESRRLLSELYLFDNLRTDRTTAAWGLEVRVPFLDQALVKFVSSIDPGYRLCHAMMEKTVLRESFNASYLPLEILHRCKEAFSDAVSSKSKSWYGELTQHIEQVLTPEDLDKAQTHYQHNPPPTLEALYYRQIFEQHYPGKSGLIPHYWMPKWVNLEKWDPSATVLKCHQGDLRVGATESPL